MGQACLSPYVQVSKMGFVVSCWGFMCTKGIGVLFNEDSTDHNKMTGF